MYFSYTVHVHCTILKNKHNSVGNSNGMKTTRKFYSYTLYSNCTEIEGQDKLVHCNWYSTSTDVSAIFVNRQEINVHASRNHHTKQ